MMVSEEEKKQAAKNISVTESLPEPVKPFESTSCATPEQIKYFIETIPQSKTKRLKIIQRYQGSKHGFTGAAFHQNSDNLGNPSVSFFFTKKGFSFAGYTTAYWSSPKAKYG